MCILFGLVGLLCSHITLAVFNPTPGDRLWNLAAETGVIASAIEGTQTRIQQSSVATGTYTVSSSGRYALVENITAPSGAIAITIAADNVYLDLNGFTIDGAGGATALINIASGRRNVTIVNGTLINAVGHGIRVLDGCMGISLENIVVDRASINGFFLDGSGGSALNHVMMRNCQTFSNGDSGIVLSNANQVIISDYVSGDDANFAVNMITSSSQITLAHFDMFQTGSSSINVSDSSRVVCIKDGLITDAGRDGIIVDNATQVTVQNVNVIKPSGVGMRFAASRIVLEEFNIVRPGSHGLRVETNASDICIENGCIQFPVSNGVLFDGFNEGFSIENVVVENAGSSGFSLGTRCEHFSINNCEAQLCSGEGFFFDDLCRHACIQNCCATSCQGSGFASNDLGNIVFVDCSAIDNREFGFEILSTGTLEASGRNQNMVFDSCEAIANYDTGFVLGRTGLIQSSSIVNCTALQNGVLGGGPAAQNFFLYMRKSFIMNNSATSPEVSNMVFADPITSMELSGENQIISNVCSSPGTGANFDDTSSTGPPNVFLGNFAASIPGGATNYTTVGTAPIIGVVTASSTTAPATFTHWTNISATNA